MGRRNSKDVRDSAMSQKEIRRLEKAKINKNPRKDGTGWADIVLGKLNEIKRERRVLNLKTVEVELSVLFFRKCNDGVAGAVFKDENGETFKVASLFSDNEMSIYAYLPKVIDQVIDELPEETATLVINSCSPQFTNADGFISMIGEKRVEVIPVHKEELFSKSSESYILAMDASRRCKNVVSEV